MNGVAVQIGELAERTGASRRSLRYYEQRNLLHSRRTAKGWRVYDEDAVTRVHNIRDLLKAGLTVDDIGQIAPCLDMTDILACDDPDDAIRTYRARLRELDERLATLQQHRDALAGRIDQLRGQAPPESVAGSGQ